MAHLVSLLTAIRLQVNDLNDQTAAPGRAGKCESENENGWLVGRPAGSRIVVMGGMSRPTHLLNHFYLF